MICQYVQADTEERCSWPATKAVALKGLLSMGIFHNCDRHAAELVGPECGDYEPVCSEHECFLTATGKCIYCEAAGA